MKISDANNITLIAWENNPEMALYYEGIPGIAKTESAIQLANKMEGYRPFIFRPSDRDSSDILGIPDLAPGAVHVAWRPPAELYQLDASQEDGKIVFIIDELSDCPTSVQNVLCGLINDRKTANIDVHPDVRILATGNRVKDRSGAQRIVSKLGNRVLRLEIHADLNDWKSWAFNNNVSSALIAFLSLRPDYLAEFNPDQFSNPTPRSWVRLDSSIPFDAVPVGQYMEAAKGLVGEAAAGDYVNFLQLFPQMPNIQAIIDNPNGQQIPTDPSLLYAVCSAFIKRLNEDTIDPIFTYMNRADFPKDFRAMFINDLRMTDSLKHLREHRCVTAVELATQKSDLAN